MDEMFYDLKPCPFCEGVDLMAFISGNKNILAKTMCLNSECPIFGVELYKKAWNTRRGDTHDHSTASP